MKDIHIVSVADATLRRFDEARECWQRCQKVHTQLCNMTMRAVKRYMNSRALVKAVQ